jgi:hypothetical protein
MFVGIASLGLFLLVSVAYFFYIFPDKDLLMVKLDENQRVLFNNYMKTLEKTWLESLFIGFSFSIIFFLVLINKKVDV